jgi:phosphate transport system ATP-binding protein
MLEQVATSEPVISLYPRLAPARPVAPEPAQTGPVALQADGVSVRLGERLLLADVSVSLRRGEVLAIIGPSGCGKSTFITTLNGMIRHTLPEAEVTGRIALAGAAVLPGPAGQDLLRRHVAMVFQRPNPFPYSIRRNLEFALRAAGLHDRAEGVRRIEDALQAVRLWDRVKDRMDDPATCLSGGEQQRLCIARALISHPDVILLDEPCSALDPVSCKAIETLVLDLRCRAAICIVTHNLAQAQRISDRCALFWSETGTGRLLEAGTTAQMLRHPTHPTTRAYVNGECC